MGHHLMLPLPETNLMAANLLRFPSIDNIANTIFSDVTDPVPCLRLRVDLVVTTKFDIKLDGTFNLDPTIRFGLTHRSVEFQMVTDAVTHILRASGCHIFQNINDYIGEASNDDAHCQCHLLYDPLSSIGLPINKDKLNPSSDDGTCLDIRINIPESSLSIDPHKLTAIHQECVHVSNKKDKFPVTHKLR